MIATGGNAIGRQEVVAYAERDLDSRASRASFIAAASLARISGTTWWWTAASTFSTW
jgi:hypothetical protein